MRPSLILLAASLLFVAATGFECASTEMTTAKVAFQKKDYATAVTELKKEVAAHPNNGEAWLILGDIYEIQNRPAEMMDAYQHARSATMPAISAMDRDNTYFKQFNAWLTRYNSALNNYNSGDYRLALAKLDTAELLRPGYSGNLYLRAQAYNGMKDDAHVLDSYTRYIASIQSDIDAGLQAGLALGITPNDVRSKLGTPTKMSVNDTTGGFAYYAPKNLYVYFMPKTAKNATMVEGWKVYTDNTPDALKESEIQLHTSPFYDLAVRAADRGKTDAAAYNEELRYLQTLQKLDPSIEGLGSEVAKVYILTNRIGEAKQLLQQQMAANPNDPQPYIEYGNLLFQAKDYTGSASSFSHVLTMGLPPTDSKYSTALFDLAAVYKNLGAALQDSIRKVSNGKPTKAQIAVFSAPLQESAKYFEQLAQAHPTDYTVQVELGNLYDVLDQKAKLNATIKTLEGMEGENSSSRGYWRGLSRLYAITGNAAKAEAADRNMSNATKD